MANCVALKTGVRPKKLLFFQLVKGYLDVVSDRFHIDSVYLGFVISVVVVTHCILSKMLSNTSIKFCSHHADMKKNLSKGDEEVEDEPVVDLGQRRRKTDWAKKEKDKKAVNHLHVARLGQIVAHAHKHRRQNQHHLHRDPIRNLVNVFK